MKQTPLFEEHKKLNARMVPFAGWMMPVLYSGITREHNAVREHAGVFDVGHMGVLEIRNSDFGMRNDQNAECGIGNWEDKILSRKISDMQAGRIRYNRILNENRFIIDDILVYAFENKTMWVVNAVNMDNVKKILTDKNIPFRESNLKAVALQGPDSDKIMSSLADVSEIKYYRFIETELLGEKVIISRTGYTGEDGFEIYTPNPVPVWDVLLQKGAVPCGLGARDTLRIEAGMPLYGHEISQSITEEDSKKLIGIEMLDRAIPREDYTVFFSGVKSGYVTSGTYSPTLKKAIAMAYIDMVNVGDTVEVEIRDQRHPARVVKLPFYKRTIR
ncbi:glycine cleavage T C-terminal barrel domain-containing protein [Candidatus Margulisiibacteriota bacterium]